MGYWCPLFPASPSLSSWFIQRNAVDIKEQRWLDTKKQGGTRLPKHYSSTGSTQEASGQLRNVTKIQDKNKHGNNSGSITTQIYLSDVVINPELLPCLFLSCIFVTFLSCPDVSCVLSVEEWCIGSQSCSPIAWCLAIFAPWCLPHFAV